MRPHCATEHIHLGVGRPTHLRCRTTVSKIIMVKKQPWLGWTLSCFKNDLGWVELISSYKMGEICCTTCSNLPWGHLRFVLCFRVTCGFVQNEGTPKSKGVSSVSFNNTITLMFFSPTLNGLFCWVCPPFLNNPISYCCLALSDSIAKKTYPMTSPHSIFLQNAWLQAQQATPPLVVFLRPGHVRPHLDSACSDGHG